MVENELLRGPRRQDAFSVRLHFLPNLVWNGREWGSMAENLGNRR